MFEIELACQNKEKGSEKQTNIPGGTISLLRKILDSMNDIVDMAEIKAKEDGISIQVIDSMHIVLADIFLCKSLFDKYRCDRDVNLGLKLKTLVTILKDINMNEESILHMSCEDEPTKLSILYKQAKYKLEWEISLNSFDTEQVNIEDVDYDAEISISPREFIVLSKSVGVFGEFLSISTYKDKVLFKQVGENASSSMTLQQDEDNSDVEINVSKPLHKMIAMKYVNNISKIAPLCSKINISMGEATPVHFDFAFYDFGYARYYIAPKLED